MENLRNRTALHSCQSISQMFTNVITPCTSKLEYFLVLLLGKLRRDAVVAKCFEYHGDSFSKPIKGKEEML